MDAAAYIRALENRQGERIVCPEVIALENGFITQDDLTKLGASLGSSSYGPVSRAGCRGLQPSLKINFASDGITAVWMET